MSDWMIRLLRMLLLQMSGPLRVELEAFAVKFRENAAKTQNPMDDVLADILCWVIGLK